MARQENQRLQSELRRRAGQPGRAERRQPERRGAGRRADRGGSKRPPPRPSGSTRSWCGALAERPAQHQPRPGPGGERADGGGGARDAGGAGRQGRDARAPCRADRRPRSRGCEGARGRQAAPRASATAREPKRRSSSLSWSATLQRAESGGSERRRRSGRGSKEQLASARAAGGARACAIGQRAAALEGERDELRTSRWRTPTAELRRGGDQGRARERGRPSCATAASSADRRRPPESAGGRGPDQGAE